jgi:hypothetical protein
MTPDEIRAAILADPALKALGEVGNDAEIAARLSTTKPARVPVATATAKQHAIENGYYGAVVIASRSHPVAQVMGAAISAASYLDDPRFQTIHMDNPAVLAMLGALVTGQVMTQPQADGFLALADSTEAVTVTADEVSAALFPLRPDHKVGPL